eukprot:5280516-Pyramimonas_sp.AAC.1
MAQALRRRRLGRGALDGSKGAGKKVEFTMRARGRKYTAQHLTAQSLSDGLSGARLGLFSGIRALGHRGPCGVRDPGGRHLLLALF